MLPTSQPEIQSHPGAAFSGLLLQSGGDAPQVKGRVVQTGSLVHQYDGDRQGLVQTALTSLSLLLSPHVCLCLSMRQFDRTALFIEACLKYGVMEANDASNILFENPLLHTELFCLENKKLFLCLAYFDAPSSASCCF